MQDADFRNADDLLACLPEDHLKVVEALRALVFECIPDAEEKLSGNIPFYHRFGRICFIWPSSVGWSKVKRTGVDIGFWRGHLLSDPAYLDKGNRKQIYVKTFHHPREIDQDALRLLLYDAVVVDEAWHQRKKSRKRK